MCTILNIHLQSVLDGRIDMSGLSVSLGNVGICAPFSTSTSRACWMDGLT